MEKGALGLFAILVMSVMSSLNCGAQTKTDLTLLRQANALQKSHGTSSKAKGAASAAASNQTVRVTAVLAKGAEIPTSRLEELGIKVSYTAFRNVGLIVPVSAVQKLDSLEEFTSFSAPKTLRLDSKTSRTVMGVTTAQDATSAREAGLPSTYTGEGVIVGVFDTGIDYNHANFRDPETKQTRIKEAMVFRKYNWNDDGSMIDENGAEIEDVSVIKELYTDPADIDTLTADVRYVSHGTNTSGIAAGSYMGDYQDVDGTVYYTGYQGVAPKADLILAGAKTLDDEFEYIALSEMDKYATKENKPLVVNLSLGSYSGWFDGKDEMSQFYDDFTGKGDKPGRVICVSSGNSADCNYTIYKELNSENNHELFTVVNNTETGDTDLPYALSTYMNIFSSSCEDTLIINTYRYSPKEKRIYSFFNHEELLASGLLYTGMCEDHDGRYMAQLYLSCGLKDSSQLIVDIESKNDCKLRIISMDTSGEPQELIGGVLPYTDSSGTECTLEATAGDNTSSINSSNCTNSIISVGAWQSNLKWYLYNRGGKGGKNADLSTMPNYKLNDICDFSSYTLSDDNGYARPDVAAPGCFIMSGYNNYDIENFLADGTPKDNGFSVSGLATEEYGRADGRHSAIGAMQGTSQACPNVAGVVALWLQANPQLTQNQIKEVIKNTADTDEYTTEHDSQFGYGKINALKGLQYINTHYPPATSVTLNETDESYPSTGIWDESKTYNITVNRTMMANTWNTLMLPFPMTADEVTANFGSDAKVVKVTGVENNVVNFETATTIEPADAYIVNPVEEKTQIVVNAKTGLKNSITTSDKVLALSEGGGAAFFDNSEWKFVGTFLKGSVDYAKGTTYVLNDNKFDIVDSDIELKGFRWVVTSTSPSAKQGLSINFDESVTTAIEEIENGKYETENGKFIETGRLVIRKCGKTYNAVGQRLY